jgi:hypothetical protein
MLRLSSFRFFSTRLAEVVMTSPDYNIVKGTRIRAQWFNAKLTCLAGVQMKVGADLQVVIGTVRHIRGNHPTNPTEIRLYVETDDGLGVDCNKCQVREIEVNPKHVVEILGK